MNDKYNKVQKTDVDYINKLEEIKASVAGMNVPDDIPHGDMPGDKIEIGDSHIAKAKTVFPHLADELKKAFAANPYQRAVVAVCGGSGVGKSEIASLLSYFLNENGIGSYTMSGDNYPHRIPKYNDAERLHIFREGAIRGLVEAGHMDSDKFALIQQWQNADDDANASHLEGNDWFKYYLEGGKKALECYLGTPNETDFAEVDNILRAFKDGADKLWLKRMGRDETALWYDEIDFNNKQVLFIEWTHGNTDYMTNVDVPVLLNSTPQETLEHRRLRNRDGKTDSAFTMMVLEIEQDKLKSQAHKAKIILSKNGEILSFADYEKLMNN